MPNEREAVSFGRYVRESAIGSTSGKNKSVLLSTNSPVDRSTGSPSTLQLPGGGQSAGGLPSGLIIAPVNSYTATPGSGTTCLPSSVTVPCP